MKTLYLVLIPNTDSGTDYARFFDLNEKIFAQRKLLYACAEEVIHDVRSHQKLNVLLVSLQNALERFGRQSAQAVEARQALERYLSGLEGAACGEHDLLLAFNLGKSGILSLLTDFLKSTARRPCLAAARVKLIWLLCGQDADLEGAAHLMYGRLPTQEICKRYKKSAKLHLDLLLSEAEQCLGAENMLLLTEEQGTRPGVEAILDALEVSIPLDLLTPLPDTRLRSRDALACLHELYDPKQYPSVSFTALAQGLRLAEEQGCFDERSLVPPAVLREVFQLSAPGNLEVARRYFGRETLFEAMSLEEPWVSYSGLDEQARRRLLSALGETLDADAAKNMFRCLSIDSPLLPKARQSLGAALARHYGQAWPPSPAKVTVLTLTRNQKEMISAAMESVLAQRADFPVEHIIVDDCSTDGTQEVIAAYAEKHEQIRPVFLRKKSRQGQNVAALFSRCRSPYVALCDGDDYYTDPNKLQTQVDFMEAHPECGLCFHPVKVVYEDGSGRERIYPPLEEMPRGVRDFYYLADLMRVNFIQTNSVMYRWRFTEGLPDWFVPDLVPGDWYWHLLHAEIGKIGFINKILSVYRRHTASLFYASEISPKANRLKHGLSELRSYDVINKHFKGRYAKVLQPLANNVFANFLEHYMETDDNGLLTTASERFPELAKDFFAEVKVVRVPGGRS